MLSMEMMEIVTSSIIVCSIHPPTQGALGAYEAGTYQQIYKKVSQESTDERLFDIVAGTSIGAINSAVLVGHYL